MDKKLVPYPKEVQEKIQPPLGLRGAKAAVLFSTFGTDKQILFAKQVFEFQDHCEPASRLTFGSTRASGKERIQKQSDPLGSARK